MVVHTFKQLAQVLGVQEQKKAPKPKIQEKKPEVKLPKAPGKCKPLYSEMEAYYQSFQD